MNLKVDFIENEIIFSKGLITSLEIENKKYFYRFIKELYAICNEGYSEEMHFFEGIKEILHPDILVVNDYFNIDLSSKKYTVELYKSIIDSIDEKTNQELAICFKKLHSKLNKILYNVDLPLEITQEYNIAVILKLMKVSIRQPDELLESLLLLIDVEKTLGLNRILFFVNLKQYLSKDELKELYKYSIYNDVSIVLVENQSHGICIQNEKKLIIDENLDEFML